MLRRLIGDSTDLAWLPKVGLWPVKMDPSQIDQALVNLCINARDAIAGVGKVTIETDMVALDEEIVLSWIFACKFLMAWATPCCLQAHRPRPWAWPRSTLAKFTC